MMTTPLVVGDHIYGIGSHGQMRGLLAETGERVWAHPTFANRHIALRNDEEIIRVSMDVNDY